MSIRHAKQSGLPADAGDTSKVQPSDWYADHIGGIRVTDAHGNSVADVVEINIGSWWVTNQGSGVVLIEPYPSTFSYPVTFNYTVDQYDGVFNAMGLQAGAGTFSNPSPSKYTATQSSDVDSNRQALKATDHSLDANSGCSHTNDVAGSWWKADFGSGRGFTPSRVGLVGRNGGGQHPRNWKLQGSNDNSAWTDLLTVSGAGPNDATWYSAAVSGSTAYRYIRVLETGTNSSGANYLVIGEIELWGVLS